METTGDVNAQGFDLFYGYHCQSLTHNHYPKFLWRNQTKEVLPGNDATLTGSIYSQDRFIEEGLAFIESNKSKPFFLYLPFTVPHLSIQVPQSAADGYSQTIPEVDYKHTAYLQHPTPRAAYAAMLTHMDRGIGQILSKLDELNLSHNTIVIFTSDNGPTYNRLGGSDSEFFHSAGDLRGLKGSLYEGGIRVPLLVRWPNHIAAGETTNWTGAFWDFLPTLCDMIGTEIPLDIDGISFAPLLTGKPQHEREFLYWESAGYGSQQAVRSGHWKAIRQQMSANKSRKQQPITTELYNLQSDESERFNVASANADILQKLEQIMTAQHVRSELFRLPGVDP